MELEFEWHEAKANDNIRKHGVSFDEAKTIFNDPVSITVVNPEHSVDEDRFIEIGLSATGQLLVVAYKERGTNIRLISCRRATKAERRIYEQRVR